jgi:hypothetical protein
MPENSKINKSRVVLGGMAAGAIIFIVTGVVNGAMLKTEFETWARGMGGLIHPLSQSASLGVWALMNLIHGIAGVWIYAGIRPRYGAGPKTALIAGLALWIVSKFAVGLDFLALGILPSGLIAGQVIGSLVAIMSGVFVGAWLYKE